MQIKQSSWAIAATAVIAIIAALFSGSDADTPTLPSGVAMQVADQQVTEQQVDRWIHGLTGGKRKPTPQERAGAVDVLAVNAWVIAEARRRGMSISPKEVAAVAATAVDGAPRADVQRFQIRLALMHKMAIAEIGPRPTPTKRAIALATKELRAMNDRPESRSLMQISNRHKKRVEDAAVALRRGDISPAAAVERYGDDIAEKASGGFYPGRTRESLRPDVAKLIFSASKGRPVGPLFIDDRWRLWVVTEIEPGASISQEQLKRQARRVASSAYDDKLDAVKERLTRAAVRDTVCSERVYTPTYCGRRSK